MGGGGGGGGKQCLQYHRLQTVIFGTSDQREQSTPDKRYCPRENGYLKRAYEGEVKNCRGWSYAERAFHSVFRQRRNSIWTDLISRCRQLQVPGSFGMS